MTHYQLVYQTRIGTRFTGSGFYKDAYQAKKVADALRDVLCGDEDSIIRWIVVDEAIS